MKLLWITLLAVAAAGCTQDAHDHDHAHPEHGPNGGELVELGDHVAHLEVLHDANAQKVTIYVLDQDLKPSMAENIPALMLQSPDGPKKLTANPTDEKHHWTFEDPLLGKEPESGRFRLKVGGVEYSPDFPEAHHH